MNFPGLYHVPPFLISIAIFWLIILFDWLGGRFSDILVRKGPEINLEANGIMSGTSLGLLSLLLGFTFSITLEKFNKGRDLSVEEANDIGTAILRCDLYPDSIRIPLRADFKEYVETRIGYYTAENHEDQIQEELQKAAVISGRIWKRVALLSQDPDLKVRDQQMIPVLNSLIDIITTRDAARKNKVPRLILVTLLIMVLATSFFLGMDFKFRRRSKFIMLAFAVVMTLTLNLIVELDHPRGGMINNNVVEQKMTDLRNLF